MSLQHRRSISESKSAAKQFVWSILLLLVMVGVSDAASLKLASCIGDHAVLQRDRTVHIWGQGLPHQEVNVLINGAKVTGKVDPEGQWDMFLNAMPAGGPFELTVTSGDEKAVATDVCFGDVWLCSGQSNMQMALKECDDGNSVAEQAEKLTNLRLCTVAKGFNGKPQSIANIQWRRASTQTARDFSAVAYYFAERLLKDPELAKVPVGIIDSSFGGTTCEGWIPDDALAKLKKSDLRDSLFGIKPGMLYNAMIAPLGKGPIKGVVWYQGESNADRPGSYPLILTTMISQWRKQFESPDLPFIIVQLPDFAQVSGGLHWEWIREAQAKAVQLAGHADLAMGIETNDGFNLHPRQKHELGRRVALLALHNVYGQQIAARGPEFRSASIEGSSVRVRFDANGKLSARMPGPIRGFSVAGEDSAYRFADAQIDGDSVILHCDQISSPKTVRYAWAGIPDSTLTDDSGVPAAPFRTDHFPPGDIEVQKQPATHQVTTGAYEVAVDGDGRVTSLVVRGKQFISNAPGAAGATSIPAFLGTRALPEISSPGPNLLSCNDDQVTLMLAFKPDHMTWTLKNRGKDPISFRIALLPLITCSNEEAAGTFRLAHGKSVLLVKGIDGASRSDEGTMLQATVKGGASKAIEFAVGN
ncbi:MAG TPA: sialate O-acetylesterase [Tepidisphaeraceae bacterium]|nr:sialate O-acetylesterase [Tepidisphaeraceae bacterium]